MLSGYDARPGGAPDALQWSARARLVADGSALAYSRDHSFAVSSPISFKPAGERAPAGLDLLLGALGGELLTAFAKRATQRGVTLDAGEVVVSAALENPLVAAGVIGETGSPAIQAVTMTIYLSTIEAEERVRPILDEILERLPLFQTLARACAMSYTLKITL